MTSELRRQVGDVELVVLPEAGGKLASLRIDGHDVLAPVDPNDPLPGGSFPMVPWAGRIRHGTFVFGGTQHQLPINMGPHAIHGTVFDRPWSVVDDATIRCDLGDRWPFAGSVTARWELGVDSLHQVLEVHADEPMPVAVGWHPWFRRHLAVSGPIELDWEPGYMFERDDEGIPTGRTVDVPPGPWDDCFAALARPPVIRWPGVLEIEVASTCAFVVVYDEPDDTVCVEPQSAPPDAVNLDDPAHAATVVEPGAPFVATMTWTWRRLAG